MKKGKKETDRKIISGKDNGCGKSTGSFTATGTINSYLKCWQ